MNLATNDGEGAVFHTQLALKSGATIETTSETLATVVMPGADLPLGRLSAVLLGAPELERFQWSHTTVRIQKVT